MSYRVVAAPPLTRLTGAIALALVAAGGVLAQADSSGSGNLRVRHQLTLLSPDYLLTEYAAAQLRYDVHLGSHVALGLHAGPSVRPGVLSEVAPLVYGLAYGGQLRGAIPLASGIEPYVSLLAGAQRNRFDYVGYADRGPFFVATEVDVELRQRGVEVDLGMDFPAWGGLRVVVEAGVFTGSRELVTEGALYPNRRGDCLFCDRVLEPNTRRRVAGIRARAGLGWRF